MMEALNSSETSVLTRATWCNNPEDGILHSHNHKNLKSYRALSSWSLQRRRNESPVRYELGFYIPADDILHSIGTVWIEKLPPHIAGKLDCPSHFKAVKYLPDLYKNDMAVPMASNLATVNYCIIKEDGLLQLQYLTTVAQMCCAELNCLSVRHVEVLYCLVALTLCSLVGIY
jgi:hypothetical protein